MQATSNQSFLDIAIQANGTLESIWDILRATGAGITDDPEVGRDYDTTSTKQDKSAMQYLQHGGYSIGSQNDNDISGVGFMTIEDSFIVN